MRTCNLCAPGIALCQNLDFNISEKKNKEKKKLFVFCFSFHIFICVSICILHHNSLLYIKQTITPPPPLL